MRTVLIIPYFGEFPSYFQIFLNSCKNNKDFNWIIYTDNNKIYDYPENVLVKKISFNEMKEKILKKFDFYFEIKSVHKLCDLKPAYGYIFEDDIQCYDFWGFCDLDVVWGKLNNFITEEILKKYDKIYTVGHLTLFRNNYENNRRFMSKYKDEYLYKKAFCYSRELVFDEGFRGSINNIYEENNYPMYTKFDCADIYTKSSNFRMVGLENDRHLVIYENKKGIFWWNKGRLLYIYREKNEILEKEYAYIHLQKRKMKVKGNVLCSESIKIVPNVFEEQLEPVTKENFDEIKKKYFNMHYFILRSKNLKYKIMLRLGLLD
ncbi:DUF6625 family protein [Konateibacter massiliensis]|uniref:DUF6625 family protein n=1 Tax=Konateibacter massiliensis TaxID=2002841 RepID=UPI000C154054|nr:DUF6625 family protein [Konateibacter massiliensis]